jgi:hypothetical protein
MTKGDGKMTGALSIIEPNGNGLGSGGNNEVVLGLTKLVELIPNNSDSISQLL